MKHQYVDRRSGVIETERLFSDRIITFLYSEVRENAPSLFRLLTQKWISDLVALANFDLPLGPTLLGNRRFLRSCGVNLGECVASTSELRTARQIFERQIRYWECRPMTTDPDTALSPSDSRVVVGSLDGGKLLYVKDKFFDYAELLGYRPQWSDAFRDGDFSVCRLTPEKYHYNHTPVAGVVQDFYEISGEYHSCNPNALIEMVTPYSKNRRVVTIIQTDVPGGTKIGLVAMVEVVALMIGDVVQRYSLFRYADPRPVQNGMFLDRGFPKSLFRPGSSAVVLLFQKDRIQFELDLVLNLYRDGAESRFSHGFEQPLVETQVQVRSALAHRKADN